MVKAEKENLNKIFLIGYGLLTEVSVKAICDQFVNFYYSIALFLKVTQQKEKQKENESSLKYLWEPKKLILNLSF